MSLHHTLKKTEPAKRLQLLLNTGMSRQSAEDYLANWELSQKKLEQGRVASKGVGLFRQSKAYLDIQDRSKYRFGWVKLLLSTAIKLPSYVLSDKPELRARLVQPVKAGKCFMRDFT
jgi:hypothetical protein